MLVCSEKAVPGAGAFFRHPTPGAGVLGEAFTWRWCILICLYLVLVCSEKAVPGAGAFLCIPTPVALVHSFVTLHLALECLEKPLPGAGAF